MSHWLIAPVLLPALLAPLMLLFLRKRLMESRVLSVAACLSLLGVAGLLMSQASDGTIQTYALGDWRAPFGIILALDRLSALMLVITAILALAVMIYSVVTGLDRKGWHFHPLFQFQLLGLNGAFLTGDLFNLFVFFEVLLIASYGLMLHGGGGPRSRPACSMWWSIWWARPCSWWRSACCMAPPAPSTWRIWGSVWLRRRPATTG